MNDTLRQSIPQDRPATDAVATDAAFADYLCRFLALQLKVRAIRHALKESVAREVRQMTIEAVTTCPGCGDPTRTLLPDGNVQDLCDECVKPVEDEDWPEVIS